MKNLRLVTSFALVVGCNPGKDDSGSAGSASSSTASSSTASSSGSDSSSGPDSDAGTSSSSGGSTSSSGSTEPTTTESADTSTTGEEQPAACMCFPGGCGASLCPPAIATCESYCDQTPPVLPDDATVECVLTALRDRTPGKLQWGDSENGGQFASGVTVWILDDGTAASTRFVAEDLCSTTGPDVLATLKEPTYFDGCLAAPDPMTRFDCMRDAIAGITFWCAPAGERCDF